MRPTRDNPADVTELFQGLADELAYAEALYEERFPGQVKSFGDTYTVGVPAGLLRQVRDMLERVR